MKASGFGYVLKACCWLLLLAVLSGCAAEPVRRRFFWPPLPERPRIEWVGVYASQYDFPQAGMAKLITGIVGETESLTFEKPLDIRSNGDGKVYVSDPGNMGTILRSALAADVDEVLLAPGSADPLSPKVVRAGAGAHFYLPIRAELDWAQISERLYGAPAAQQTLLAEADAQRAYDDVDMTVRTALIVGNEAHGPSTEATRLATERVMIPMWNKIESLNAAVAASVILFEAARQRRAKEAGQPKQNTTESE